MAQDTPKPSQLAAASTAPTEKLKATDDLDAEARREAAKDVSRIQGFFLCFTLVALVALVLHQFPDIKIATPLLWAMGCMAVGAAAGFLFGVPKILQGITPNQTDQKRDDSKSNGKDEKDTEISAVADYKQQVNTNLTEISDWLTKIIVGVGLVELQNIPGFLRRISTPLAAAFNPPSPTDALAVAAAVTVCFTVIGFLFGYLSTRLILAGAFSLADQAASLSTRRRIDRVVKQQDAAYQNLGELAALVTRRVILDPVSPDLNPAPAEKKIINLASQVAEEKAEKQRTSNDWFVLANKAFSEARLTDAVRLARRALADKPDAHSLWEIHNFLGLAYHYQQAPDWKPGQDMSWFQNAIRCYKVAIDAAPTSDERLISTANLAFVYLDSEDYTGAEETAQKVLAAQTQLGNRAICDLARIAIAAAAVMQGDEAKASKYLNETEAIAQFQYLFQQKDISPEISQRLSELKDLRPEVRDVIRSSI